MFGTSTASAHQRRNHLALIPVAFVVAILLLSGCGSTGACVGTGGVLSSPECKDAWTEEECQDWDTQGINGANWTFNSGDSCPDLGYTAQCSDGSYRQPGAC